MSEPQKRKRIEIPREFDSVERQLIGELIIERIIERTNDNRDVTGKKFAPYSESYTKSLNFKIAGKSKSDVDLQLTGDMLNSIKVLEQGPGFISIGYTEGTVENDKAFWTETADNGPSRKFVGISENDLEIILAKVKSDRPRTLQGLANQEQVVVTSRSTTKEIANSILRRFFADLD